MYLFSKDGGAWILDGSYVHELEYITPCYRALNAPSIRQDLSAKVRSLK